jgi:hypothetical protein
VPADGLTMRPTTQREWIAAFLLGLEKSGYTGRVELTIDLNHGGITRLIPMKQEVLTTTE